MGGCVWRGGTLNCVCVCVVSNQPTLHDPLEWTRLTLVHQAARPYHFFSTTSGVMHIYLNRQPFASQSVPFPDNHEIQLILGGLDTAAQDVVPFTGRLGPRVLIFGVVRMTSENPGLDLPEATKQDLRMVFDPGEWNRHGNENENHVMVLSSTSGIDSIRQLGGIKVLIPWLVSDWVHTLCIRNHSTLDCMVTCLQYNPRFKYAPRRDWNRSDFCSVMYAFHRVNLGGLQSSGASDIDRAHEPNNGSILVHAQDRDHPHCHSISKSNEPVFRNDSNATDSG